jgi:cellulose biosynthesis protein BcsQ
MVSIAMFNNKGGVGKTTLTNNIAAYISDYYQKRVLVVDCDPQCNSTQLLMGQEFSSEFYLENISANKITTISDILRPIEVGDSNISTSIIPIKSSETRFNVDLIPGNPKFSIIEDRLGAAWHDSLSGDIGGIRKTHWNTFLLDSIAGRYDFVFYDLGPSLGSINRSVLIGCDYFLTPMGTDIFSILGIKNISEWLTNWLRQYNRSVELCEINSPNRLSEFKIPISLKINQGYIGYTIQQYITKSIKGTRRPTRAYDKIINDIPQEIDTSLKSYLKSNLNKSDLKLGDVPHLYSLIPLAQSNACPIFKLKGSDGIVGTQFKQLEDYNAILKLIVGNLFKNLDK